jgi:pilus assembly protein CpaF
LIIHVARLVDGSRRITQVSEVVGMEGDVVTLQEVFSARGTDDRNADGFTAALLGPLASAGLRPYFLPKLAANGVFLNLDLLNGTAA